MADEEWLICDGEGVPTCRVFGLTCQHHGIHRKMGDDCAVTCGGSKACRKATDAEVVMAKLEEYEDGRGARG